MERYIIPFDFDGKSFYVCVDKDAARQVYLIVRLMPHTDERYQKEISFSAIAEMDASAMKPHTLELAIKLTLHKFLQSRGWLAMAN